ncbi:uncharacterized protein LOC135497661 [Lineus longissimus]|uniref:uncharacterized protein LOC135497661 n=1 Tax=Lineus longissimus TaxID=88925 RepID=UPI00315D4EA4
MGPAQVELVQLAPHDWKILIIIIDGYWHHNSGPKDPQRGQKARANVKRTLTSLSKEADSLLAKPGGLPEDEFRDLATKLREHLDTARTINNIVITLSTDVLNTADFKDAAALEKAEFDIETTETAYIEEIAENVLPRIHDLQRKAEELHAAKPKPGPVPTTTPFLVPPPPAKTMSSRMAKLKFPTFGGNIRDYRQFRQQFGSFTKDLEPNEKLYQLVESMDRPREKQKIKNCTSIDRAWSILDKEYGDKDRLVDTLISDLEKIDVYHTKGHINVGHMSRFVETLQNFSTHFESLGMTSDLSGRVMLTQLRRKLPEEHHSAFLKAAQEGQANDTITGLQDWLHDQLMVLRKARPPPPTQDHQSRTHKTDSSTSKTSNSITINHAAMTKTSPAATGGAAHTGSHEQGKRKCPLHPQTSNHFIKGCNKFRALSQTEKFDIMNINGICHRCWHDDCVAGKPPFDPQKCQHSRPCAIPVCGADTHFSSICPKVYGTDGYRHFEMKKNLNPTSLEFKPTTPNTNVGAASIGINQNKTDTISCALPTVMGYLVQGQKKTLVRILLDTGSQASLIREGIVPMQGKPCMQNFNLTTVGGNTVNCQLRVVECTIENLEGTFSRSVHLTEMKKPCGNVPILSKSQLESYPHLKSVDIVGVASDAIDVLLGVDNGDLLTPAEKISGPTENDPIAARCPLGWYVQGGSSPAGEIRTNAVTNFTLVTATSEIEDFLGIEHLGIAPKRCKCAVDEENRVATEKMQRSLTVLDNGTYQISLPWKRPPSDLPNNYEYAVKRLQNLEKQFRKKPNEWDTYCKQMDDQLTRGVARFVPQSEMDQDLRSGKGMWFLPHFGVLKDSRTTPVRVVFDGKARFEGCCLNDFLAKGDNMNSNIFDIGLRFREYEVGVAADISKMFQSIKLNEDDARYHRFLFRKKPDEPIRVFELTTVTFGDKPSPTAAIVTLRLVVKEHAPDDLDMQQVVSNQFYVDDLNDSKCTVKEGLHLKTTVTSTLHKGHFGMKEICDPDNAPDRKATVLGTRWNLAKDTLSVKEVASEDYAPFSKRLHHTTTCLVFSLLSPFVQGCYSRNCGSLILVGTLNSVTTVICMLSGKP